MSLRYDGHLEVFIPPPTILDWTRSNVFDSKVKGRLMSSSYGKYRQRHEYTGSSHIHGEMWVASSRGVRGSPE